MKEGAKSAPEVCETCAWGPCTRYTEKDAAHIRYQWARGELTPDSGIDMHHAERHQSR
jgi:hypothetical protein